MLIRVLLIILFCNSFTIAADYTWDGGGDGSTWDSAANWGGTGYPDGNDDTATFNATNTGDVTIPAGLTIGALTLDNGYTGTLTMAGDLTLDGDAGESGSLTLNDGVMDFVSYILRIDGSFLNSPGANWTQGTSTVIFTAFSGNHSIDSDGEFFYNINFERSGSTATWTLQNLLHCDGTFTIHDGIFNTGTDQDVQIDGEINILGGEIIGNNTIFQCYASGTFTDGKMSSGTLFFRGDGTYTAAENCQLFNVTYSSAIRHWKTVTISGTLNVDGTLTWNTSSILNGDGILAVGGDLICTETSINGAVTVLFDGTGNQLVQVDGTGGTGEFPGTVEINRASEMPGTKLTMIDRLRLNNDWLYTSGTVDMSTSELVCHRSSVTEINAGTMIFNDLTFDNGTTWGNYTITGTCYVNGTLSIISGNGHNGGGSYICSGDIIISDSGTNGDVNIEIVGAGDQALHADGGTGDLPHGITINKPSGTLTISDSFDVGNAWTYTAGIVEASTSTIKFNEADSFTISSSGMTFGNVIFSRASYRTTTISGDMDIDGYLTWNESGTCNGDTIYVAGDFTISETASGNAAIVFDGNGIQQLDMNGGAPPLRDITITKTGGTVILINDLLPSSAVTDISVSNCVFDLAGYNVDVQSISIESDATLQLQGAETISANINLATGSTVSYTGNGDSLADDYQLLNLDYHHLEFNLIDSADRVTTPENIALIARYTFDDGSGSTASDSTGTYDATLQTMDDSDWITDRPAAIANWSTHSLTFDGTSDWVDIPDAAVSEITGSFTYSAWIKTNVTDQLTIISTNQSNGDNRLLLFVRDDYLNLFDGAMNPGNVNISDDNWHHVAATLDNSSGIVRYYIDGVEDSAASYTTATRNGATDSLQIGMEYDGSTPGDFWDGEIDDLRIYNTVLKGEVINKLASGQENVGLIIRGDVSINNGTWQAPSTALIDGDINFSGGTFDANNGSINLSGSSSQTITTASNHFYELEITNTNGVIFADTLNTTNLVCESADASITFLAGSTNTISNNLTINGGAASDEINLLSSGSTAFLSLGQQGLVQYVNVNSVEITDIGDIDCWALYSIDSDSDSYQASNNGQWVFVDPYDYVWTGATDTTWADQTNWRLEPSDGSDGNDGYPDGVEDSATFPTGFTSDEISTPGALSLGLLDLQSGFDGSVILNGTLTLTNDAGVGGHVLVSDGILRHPDNSSLATHSLNAVISGNLFVDADGLIGGSGYGFDDGYGPGTPTGASDAASHGGHGSTLNGALQTGSTYGDPLEPITLGSGGEPGPGTHTEGGGGAYIFNVSGSTTINGAIRADAQHGGSGGSVNIRSHDLNGSGIISANGTATANYAGGGGGRIAIRLTGLGEDFSGFAGSLSAIGGNSSSSNRDGAGGTIYLQTAAQGENAGQLIIDAGSRDSIRYGTVATPVIADNNPGGSLNIGNLHIRNSAYALINIGDTLNCNLIIGDSGTGSLEPSGTLNFNNIQVDSTHTLQLALTDTLTIPNTLTLDGQLDQFPNSTISDTFKLDLAITGDLNISATGQLGGSGGGYDINNGPGYPGSGADNDAAAHGGQGATLAATTQTSTTYGDPVEPITHGSGGRNAGAHQAGGGGVIILDVTGTTTVTGSINQDGTAGASGGSVNIRTEFLAGAGAITANGGVSGNYAGGGGGRVAIRLDGVSADFTGFSGNIEAFGGNSLSGDRDGAAGTIYLQTTDDGEGNGQLLINNNGLDTRDNTFTTLDDEDTNSVSVGSLDIDENGSLVIGSDDSLSLNSNGNPINVSATGTLSNDGSLNLSGTNFTNNGTWTNNTGSILTYTGQADDSTVNILDLAVDSVVFNNAGTIFTIGANLSAAEDLTLSAGTFTSAGFNITVEDEIIVSAGEMRISTGSTMSVTSGPAISVANGATISGDGAVTAGITLADGAIIEPGDGAGGDLGSGALTLNNTTALNFELDDDADPANDQIVVTGDFTADGSLSISDLSGNFGVGSYTLLTYSGSLLANNGISLGTMPAGFNYNVSVGGGAVTLTVSVPTVLQSATFTDLDNNGVDAGDTIDLVFNNNLASSSYATNRLGLPVADDALAGTVADQSAVDNTLTLTLSGAPQLSPGGTYTILNITAGYSSGLFINDATGLIDYNGFTIVTGNASNAVDLLPTSNTIAVQWADTQSTTKTWAIGSTSLSQIHNSVDDSVNLGIRNVGDGMVDLDIAISAMPTGWTVASSVSENTFLLKADNASLPAADQEDPSYYELTLSGVNQDLFNNIYSGHLVDWEALFQLPSSVTGGGGSNSMTITITAEASVP